MAETRTKPTRSKYGPNKVRLAIAPAWNEERAGHMIGRLDRVDEITGERETRKANCPFCDHSQHLPPIAVEKSFMIIPGKAPPVPGHALIVPLEHREAINEFSDNEMKEFGDIMLRIHSGMKRARKPVWFGMNWRKIAGQSLAHTHTHILPVTGKQLPAFTEHSQFRFFDPLAEQVIEKIKQKIETHGGELKEKAKFSPKRGAPITFTFQNVDEFKRAGNLLRELFSTTEEVYKSLLRDPRSAFRLKKYGDAAEAKWQSDVRLLKGDLPSRVGRLKQQAQSEGAELPENVAKELVRSNEVGANLMIEITPAGKVKMNFIPRATVVKPASPTEAMKGRRDVQPWGTSSFWRESYYPVREGLRGVKMTAAQLTEWDKKSRVILQALQKSLKAEK